MRNNREGSSIRNQTPQSDTTTGERAYTRTLAAARVTGRRAPTSTFAAVRRSATHQPTSSRRVRNVLRWLLLSGDPRLRSSPDNALATPNARAFVAAFAPEARGADEGEAKQTSASRSRDGEPRKTSSQSILILIRSIAADRPAIGEERDGVLPFWGFVWEGNPKEWGEEPRKKWRLPLNCSAKPSFVHQLTPEGRRRRVAAWEETGRVQHSSGPDGPVSFIRYC